MILDVIDRALELFGDYGTLAGRPAAGLSWEGFGIENLPWAVPMGTLATDYPTSTGAGIDLLLEMPGRGWKAIDINGGAERYWMTPEVEAMGVVELARELAGG